MYNNIFKWGIGMAWNNRVIRQPVLDYRMFENQEKETTTSDALGLLKGKTND